jgi:hypothetical protein
LGIFAMPWGFRLAPFRPDHLTIVLFLPASILAAILILTLLDGAQLRWPHLRARLLGAMLVAGLCGYGIWDTRDIVNPVTILADAADRAALIWIQANTPPDARFLTNETYWQAGLYRGVDGGWWLLPAAGRQTVLPPALYGMGADAYVQSIIATAKQVALLNGCSPAFWQIARTEQVKYLYLHEGRGSMQPAAFMDCAGLTLVYQKNGVSVFLVGMNNLTQ